MSTTSIISRFRFRSFFGLFVVAFVGMTEFCLTLQKTEHAFRLDESDKHRSGLRKSISRINPSMKPSFRLLLQLLVASFCGSGAFVSPAVGTFDRGADIHASAFFRDNDDILPVGTDADCVSAPDSADLLRALENRKWELKGGIGKRYICRTQQGFLNVHKEPVDPFNTSNIVAVLNEGQIVTSTGPRSGFWIPHDGGGWSISEHGGFTWLEELQE